MIELTETAVDAQLAPLRTLRNAIAEVIVGQDQVVEQLLTALLAKYSGPEPSERAIDSGAQS